jgi:hypothetical protein
MSKKNLKDCDFTYELIKILRSDRVDEKNRIDLRVIKWTRADKPVLEKRRVWERKGGDRAGKMVGLSIDDVSWVFDNYHELINLL